MISAPIDKVKVYRHCAVVRRKAEVSLKSGTNDLILFGISRSADLDSLRLFFPAGVTVNDLEIVPLEDVEQSLPSAKVNDEILELQSKYNILKTVEELWITNGSFAGSSRDSLDAYLEALPGHLDELRIKKTELVKRIADLQKEKAKLEEKEAFQALCVSVDSSEDCFVPCEIEYLDNQAWWNSIYEIHTSADSDELKVISRARIIQNTFEDWENIDLTLYTGNPAAPQNIPTLKKLDLGLRSEPSGNTLVPGLFAAPRACAAPSADLCEASVMPRMAMAEAEETDDDTMSGYSLPGRRTVPRGSMGALADLKENTIPAGKRVVCVPKLDSCAYLAAMIKTEDWPLKPSSARIYLNETYCGETYVNPDMTKETFMLSLGRDERIGVSRETIRSRTEDVMLKGQKRKISEYSIKISNRQDKPVAVLVCDQIPVSTDKQITVDRVSAVGASIDEKTGNLNWDITVDGKAVEEKQLSYTVTYPKDRELNEHMTSEKGEFRICSSCGAYAQGELCPKCGAAVK